MGICKSSYEKVMQDDIQKTKLSHWAKVVLYLCGIRPPESVAFFHFSEDLQRNHENDDIVLEEMKIFEDLSALFRASIRSEDGMYAIQLCRHPCVFTSKLSAKKARVNWKRVAFSIKGGKSSELKRCKEESIPQDVREGLKDAMLNCLEAAKAEARGRSDLQSSTSQHLCCQASINEFIVLAKKLFIRPSENVIENGWTIEPDFNPVQWILQLAPYLSDEIEANHEKISGFLR